jgi:transcription elongation GreA/GreB family factor
MSRAFVKEIDDAPEPPLPERPVSAAPNRVTARGARLIEQAVAGLERQIAVAEPTALPLLQRDLRYWQARRASMQPVPADPAPAAVGFGVRATVIRGGRTQTLGIVGEDEADPAAGLIAWTSPLARALEGAEPGEAVEFAAGGRTEVIEVVAVGPG